MVDKLQAALELSEDILSGIETETINLAAAALRCLRLARLMSDVSAIEWLQYEAMGYPKEQEGLVRKEAFDIALAHGRSEVSSKDSERRVFLELADELTMQVQTAQEALKNFTTEGASVSGDAAWRAMNELTSTVSRSTDSLLKLVQTAQSRLCILRGQYYAYALSVNLELKFSQRAEEVFRSYRLSVDNQFIQLAPESLKRLDAAYERLSSANPESWSQALTSCRRVFQELSDALFERCCKSGKEKSYTTLSGKVLDVSGENYLNRLFAVVDSLEASRSQKRLVGSELMYVVDWIEKLYDILCRGVHKLDTPLAYEDARAGILHTYMLLGDIAVLLLGNDENGIPSA